MSETPQNPSDQDQASEPKQPEHRKEHAESAKPAPKAEEEAPTPPEPGKFGQMLREAGLPFTPLGEASNGMEMIEVLSEHLLDVGRFLRDDPRCRFDLLLSVSGIDMKDYRMSVVHLYSLYTHETLVVKTKADGEEKVQTLTPVWPAADWHERESFDLMGIVYEGHPDLRRILMPIDWIGHPLRKDYVENDPRLVWNRR